MKVLSYPGPRLIFATTLRDAGWGFSSIRVLRGTERWCELFKDIQLVSKPLFSPSTLAFSKRHCQLCLSLENFRAIPSPAGWWNWKIKLIFQASWNHQDVWWHTAAADWETSVLSSIDCDRLHPGPPHQNDKSELKRIKWNGGWPNQLKSHSKFSCLLFQMSCVTDWLSLIFFLF